MRSLLVLALGLSFACAGMSASGSGTAQASCAPTTTNKGVVVYSAPDGASSPIANLKPASQVCADSNTVGFGYRHVKLADGREGYVHEEDLI